MDCSPPGNSVHEISWDFLGKNTGVSCHFLLHLICFTLMVKSILRWLFFFFPVWITCCPRLERFSTLSFPLIFNAISTAYQVLIFCVSWFLSSLLYSTGKFDYPMTVLHCLNYCSLSWPWNLVREVFLFSFFYLLSLCSSICILELVCIVPQSKQTKNNTCYCKCITSVLGELTSLINPNS